MHAAPMPALASRIPFHRQPPVRHETGVVQYVYLGLIGVVTATLPEPGVEYTLV